MSYCSSNVLDVVKFILHLCQWMYDIDSWNNESFMQSHSIMLMWLSVEMSLTGLK